MMQTAAAARGHDHEGSRAGLWSASAPRSLRITFLRLEGGRNGSSNAAVCTWCFAPRLMF
jgi:hypothetical protein